MIVGDSSGDTVKSDPLARVINSPTNDNTRIGKNAVLSIYKIKSHDFNVALASKTERNTAINRFVTVCIMGSDQAAFAACKLTLLINIFQRLHRFHESHSS